MNNRKAVILRVSLCETSCFAAQNHFIESSGKLKNIINKLLLLLTLLTKSFRW
jgi:hypothetical protein